MPRTAPGNPLFLRDEAIDLQFELWFLASAGIHKSYAADLDQTGIDTFDLFVLFMIRRHDNQTMANLVAISGRPKQVVSRRIQLLEDKGLIERIEDLQDRRRRLLRLSEKGMERLERIVGQMRRYLRRAFSRAGSAPVDGFNNVLAQLAEPTVARRLGIAVE